MAKDNFGQRGVRLKPMPGQRLRVEVKRTILARRMGRLTGAGLFAESRKLGLDGGWLESGIAGQDSVQNAVHRGQLFWFWGDTSLARYPLGIFDGTGATSAVQCLPSLQPPLRLRLDYFTHTASGPTWVTGVASVPDKYGTQQLVCASSKIKPPLEVYEWSLAVWSEKKQFEKLKTVSTKSEGTPKALPIPEGHLVL